MMPHIEEKIKQLTNLQQSRKKLGIYFIVVLIYALLGMLVGGIVRDTGQIFYFFIYMIPVFVLAIFVNKYPKPKYIKIMTLQIYKLLQTTTNKAENIDEIVLLCDKIHNECLKYNFIVKYNFFLTKHSTERLYELVDLVYSIMNSILTNLRSDLATRLTEQKQILEGAKTEVEKNLTGTPELLAVSELQKTRLDRQIEQFEELQRVLVRV